MDNFLTIFSRTFPLVKIIEIKDKLYAYDAQSNLLTNVTINQLKSIYDFYVNDTITDDHSIADLLDKNIFSPNINRRITYDTEKINDLIENQMRNYFPRRFMLEITEQCTLRCRYCFYTTSDNTKRGHSNNTIKKGLL